MTSKEKAEEYAQKKVTVMFVDENDEFFTNAGTIKSIMQHSYSDGYSDGFAEGKPKWHDLRKKPEDLPKKMGLGSREVYVAYADGVTDFASYHFDRKKWTRSENDKDVWDIVAWCEIPRFEEKTE